jgi:hypothetical protein
VGDSELTLSADVDRVDVASGVAFVQRVVGDPLAVGRLRRGKTVRHFGPTTPTGGDGVDGAEIWLALVARVAARIGYPAVFAKRGSLPSRDTAKSSAPAKAINTAATIRAGK